MPGDGLVHLHNVHGTRTDAKKVLTHDGFSLFPYGLRRCPDGQVNARACRLERSAREPLAECCGIHRALVTHNMVVFAERLKMG